MPTVDARQACTSFLLTLLARRVAAGPVTRLDDERRLIEHMWKDPLVQRRWQRLALRLTAADCERIGRLAADRGLAGTGVRWLGVEQATEGWSLGSVGYAVVRVRSRGVVNGSAAPRSALVRSIRPGSWQGGAGDLQMALASNDA